MIFQMTKSTKADILKLKKKKKKKNDKTHKRIMTCFPFYLLKQCKSHIAHSDKLPLSSIFLYYEITIKPSKPNL